MKTKIELHPQFKQALELMENSSKHVFITGKAGTGKSTLLTYFRDHSRKNLAVLAPTGVAAVNIKGQTIHSFFGFKPDITVEKVKRDYKNREKKGFYKKLDAILIDEISMVRADLLDCVDIFLRLNGPNKKKPFGGLQMIFIGDLYQLPPVVTDEERHLFKSYYKSPYFFDAKVFEDLNLSFVELTKIYRQRDANFIKLLNAVRNRCVTEEHLSLLNTRVNPSFEPDGKQFFIHLTPTNKMADSFNQQQLARLSGRRFTYKGVIRGDFDEKALPTDLNLSVKIGAQIMLVNNDSQGRWINGTVGKIVDIEHDEETDSDVIFVELDNGQIVEVLPYTWQMFRFYFNQQTGRIDSESIGSFTQYPLMLAWAVTIHKSQGKTFDRVILDIGSGTFAHGQSYVALSRCTSLEGLILKKPFLKKHILMDWRVVKFLTSLQYQLADKQMSVGDKLKMIKQTIQRNGKLRLIYLKTNDEKTERLVKPEEVGEMEYLGKKFLGMQAYCLLRRDRRVFRLDRILEMKTI